MTGTRSHRGPRTPTEGRAVMVQGAETAPMTGNGPARDRQAVTIRPERAKRARNAPRFLGQGLGGHNAATDGHDAPKRRAQRVTNRPR